MMFTNEFLRQTFIKNDIIIGDFAGLYYQLKKSSLKLATAEEVNWPDDMDEYVWNPESLKELGVGS
ncbi:MAG: hypothetical protein AAF063_38090 [Cyanobacteria bacterium J06643_5]